jgi:hypothetical protein
MTGTEIAVAGLILSAIGTGTAIAGQQQQNQRAKKAENNAREAGQIQAAQQAVADAKEREKINQQVAQQRALAGLLAEASGTPTGAGLSVQNSIVRQGAADLVTLSGNAARNQLAIGSNTNANVISAQGRRIDPLTGAFSAAIQGASTFYDVNSSLTELNRSKTPPAPPPISGGMGPPDTP